MLFHVELTYSPENCWARGEHEGKANELIERVEGATESLGVSVQSAFVAPNEHTFYLMLGSETFEALTSFLGPRPLQAHKADVVPVTTPGERWTRST